jgi:hypothetical protein
MGAFVAGPRNQALIAISVTRPASGGLFHVFARKVRFVETIQSDFTSPVLFAKIFPFQPDPNHLYIPRVPPPFEGRFAIVTDVGGGMRWTRMAP